MENLENMPSNDFVERALSHIKDMHQATGELAEEPGLPPEAKHDLQSIMDDNAAPIQNSPASVEGSASEKGNDLTTRMPAYAGVDMQFSHYNPLIRQLGGRYTLIRPLGRGGMANVYLVWDEQTQREVAAKVMIPDVNDPERSQRFLREGQIAVSLHHQHIVHVYDYGDRVQVKMPNDPDALSSNELILPYVVMEYVGGGDLKDRLITGKAYPLDETVRIFKQLSAAVQYIHDRGMVHRDIKPANILFRKPSQEDGQAEVVLSDFGLAIDDNVTLSNPYAGTLAYMAPEQWGGNPQKASDIYSLGVVLYQLCVGAPPSPWVLSRKSGQLNSSLPSSELDNVILRALSSDPSQRFASVSLFCQALEEAAKQVKLPIRVPGIVTQAVLSPPDRATGKEEIAETVDSTRIDDAGEAHPSLHDLSSVGLSSPVIDVTMQPSRKGEVRKRRQVGIVAFAVILCLVFSFGGIAFFASQGTTTPGIGIINKPHNEPIGVSDGTYTFDVGTDRVDASLKIQAAAKFAEGDKVGAKSLWNQAVGISGIDTSDAEALIYLEDQRVLASGSPYVTLVVGATLTGGAANISEGRDNLQGAYVAQKEYNDGMNLGGGRLLRLLIANAGSQPDYATEVAEQIVRVASRDTTVIGVMGWSFSAYTQRAIPVLTNAHIPMVSSTASADSLSGISPYFFRIAPPNDSQAIAGAKYAEQQLHASRVALFVDPKNSYSRSLADDFTRQFVADGNKIVDKEDYTVGNKAGLYALLQKALSSNPDLIYFAGYADDLAVLLVNLPTSQPNLQVLGGDALYELGGYPLGERAGFSRLHFTAFAYPDEWSILMGDAQPFFSEYSAAFNPANADHNASPYGFTRADGVVILSYDAMHALLQGCKNALAAKNALTPDAVRKGLTLITGANAFQGVSGQIAFGHNGDPVNKAVVILYVDQDGYIHLLQPDGVQGCFKLGACG